MNLRRLSTLLLSLLIGAVSVVSGQGQVRISEFLAANTRTLADQDGEFSDWVELYNAGPQAAQLAGWYLTDTATNLTKWRFPQVSLEPNEFLLVFASGKDRATTGSELHTNFRLSSSGDYLALVKPDGTTVASSFSPRFPVQVSDVSYGLPMQQTEVPLISGGAAAKWLVPANDNLGSGWTDPEWNDTDWGSALTGVGYETADQPAVVVTVADSAAEFSGNQGQDNWFYGSYNKSADPTFGYQVGDFVAFPRDSGPHSAANYWSGSTWDWFNGDPPWLEIGPSFTHPNGVNNGAELWAIRRWRSEVTGTITVQWHLAKQTPFGSGVTGRVYHQGVQKDLALIAGDDLIGLTKSVVIPDVQAGDFIDFALAPTGTASATDDRSDGSFLDATVRTPLTLASQIKTSLETSMRNFNATAYLRIPFLVANPSAFEFLTLRMKYDDGFAAYLNGVEVARRQAPDTLAWNSAATAKRERADAFQFEEFDLSGRLGLLHVGTNVLAIHGLNASPDDAEFLLLPELVAAHAELNSEAGRYFSLPSPGTVNGPGRTDLGPLIVEVRHTPNIPSDDQDLVVTARAAPTFDPVRGLTLYYRVMFGAELNLPMLDDGLHGDGAAGDGVFGASIPAGASGPGQMVRYYISAVDAKSHASRWPLFQDARNSPQYLGTVVADPTLTNALPVLHWFIQNPTAADNNTGTRCAVFFMDEFYDNVGVNLHGQSSTSFPKKSYDIDFSRGFHFRYDSNQRRVEDFNLLTTYPDKAHIRNILAYETYRDAGSAYHVAFALRVQRNGAFFSDAHFVEDADDTFLARLGLSPKGALYKMYNVLDSATGSVEKKNRKFENNADLQALINGVRRTGVARTQFLFDNINIPSLVNYLAAMIITGGTDCCHKNYYAYRDTEGTGEWQYLPWDVDLTFGRNWNSANTYYDDTMFSNNPLFVGSNNLLISALFNTPAFRQMYLRRVRTLMDDLLQSTNTSVAMLKYERRIDELAALIGPDAALDFAKWQTWGQKQTLPQAVSILKNQYFPARRRFLAGQRDIPAAQPTNAMLVFGAFEINPDSGRQAEEYLQLINTNRYAVDISGWKLTGPIEHTFAPGVVLPTNGSVYVSPDVVAFRARTVAPRGGQSLFVQGNYRGQLTARGATLRLLDPKQREAATLTYAGSPTPAQESLRVTEIMFHPLADKTAAPDVAENLEYLVLKNIGPQTLDLAGVQFTNGIYFRFTNSPVNLLPAGHSIYLVKNPAAFTARYGLGFNIAGPYSGSLNNGGEKLRLDDARGETVLDFAYDDSWYPTTDGQGFSLVIVDETARWDTWGEKSAWRPSLTVNGSPASQTPDLTAWRTRYFTAAELANPSIAGDDADPDNDLYSNRSEFVSGTNPRDRQSLLKVESIAAEAGAGGAVKFRFQAAADRSYSIQYSDAPVGSTWRKLTDVTRQSFQRLVEISDSTAGRTQARYYRIVTPMLP